MNTDIGRWIEPLVISALSARRVVNLAGARQTGKTTLAGHLDIPGARRLTLDDDTLLRAAIADPTGFVQQARGTTTILDEIQKAPSLLPAIKQVVDQDRSKGQYLLTGSANLRFASAVSDSLAGRMRTIRLRTLAEAEIRGRKPDFLGKAFAEDFPDSVDGFDKRTVANLAFRGGYPEVLDLSGRERREWYRGYLDDLLFRDIRDITEIRKLDVLRDVATWLAAHSGKFFSIDELAASSRLSKPTAENYLGALSALYLFDKIPAWSKTDYAKAGKRPKWFACDSGLVANCLAWNEDEACLDPDRSGKLVETWAHNELAVRCELSDGCALSHYRDSAKREIDFIVENGSGHLLGIEVKAGSSVRSDDFAHLRWFRDNLAKGKFVGIVLYAGSKTVRFGPGFHAVPLGTLANG